MKSMKNSHLRMVEGKHKIEWNGDCVQIINLGPVMRLETICKWIYFFLIVVFLNFISHIVEFTSYTHSECKYGHTIPRCSLTLVQVYELPYYCCSQCGALAHRLGGMCLIQVKCMNFSNIILLKLEQLWFF